MINFDKRLTDSFYLRSDVVQIARELLGMKIFTFTNNVITAGIITETEAYSGMNDKACHAHLGKFTKRTSTMYEKGGSAYIYLCYGIHHLFNIVTNIEGKADAVLIRAIEPIEGVEVMHERRSVKSKSIKLGSGPGKLTQALGITKDLNGIDLTESETIWIERGDKAIHPNKIIADKRIGIDYAEEDALLPWRFYISQNKSVSKF
ncbi:DNA-3-methyladenine glycosylase [Marivirga lumbricoides]|uniref:Putative 3-methyladenine DNA glycosylase n=1 Tax=Marivirga lumbricoides TaxID=1046115 RepID=A0A2T4DKZ1_9BACT|nr:DNA-3-methyladenine glycosylase [Marivirga lumbricoides]